MSNVSKMEETTAAFAKAIRDAADDAAVKALLSGQVPIEGWPQGLSPMQPIGVAVTEHRETTRYATPSLRRDPRKLTPSMTFYGSHLVTAHPWGEPVGRVEKRGPGWTAHTPTNLYAGLWPTKQAAAEVLVRQAGYELGEGGR